MKYLPIVRARTLLLSYVTYRTICGFFAANVLSPIDEGVPPSKNLPSIAGSNVAIQGIWKVKSNRNSECDLNV